MQHTAASVYVANATHKAVTRSCVFGLGPPEQQDTQADRYLHARQRGAFAQRRHASRRSRRLVRHAHRWRRVRCLRAHFMISAQPRSGQTACRAGPQALPMIGIPLPCRVSKPSSGMLERQQMRLWRTRMCATRRASRGIQRRECRTHHSMPHARISNCRRSFAVRKARRRHLML